MKKIHQKRQIDSSPYNMRGSAFFRRHITTNNYFESSFTSEGGMSDSRDMK
jgi:hypothetical protein